MQNNSVRIEKGIPLPNSLNSKYAIFKEMAVGDSVYFSPEFKGVGAAAYTHFPNRGCKVRKEGEGVRVWRVK